MTTSRPGPRLELRQAQQLAMTQQLQQSIRLLQLSSVEVNEFIAQELEKNPFLSQEEGEGAAEGGDGQQTESQQAESAPAESNAPVEVDRAVADDEVSGFSGGEENDNWDYSFTGGRYSGGGGGSDEDGPDIADAPQQDKTLRQYLLEQLHMDVHDPVKRMIGTQLIDLVDDAGYIKEDLTKVAEQLGAETAMVEEVLGTLQAFDPAGVCARNLEECLSIQLRERDRLDPAMECLLTHLDWLAEARMAELQRACGVDTEDLKQMIAELRALNPKPGHGFEHEPIQAVEPDVYLRRLPDGNWHVELNTQSLPRVLVNRRYFSKLSSGARSGEEKKYLSDQMGMASWLVKALDQRAQTILKVATEIVAQQDAFFRLGVRYMKPLTLREVAAETGFHESTVSRVTTHKYIMSPRGMHELKYFFTSGVQRATGTGEDVSSEAVKHLIGEMIGRETLEHIFSDDEIADALKEKNINVARRTVAKYREAMGLGSSVQRRRQKKSQL